MRLVLALIVIGGVVAFLGWQEYAVASGCSAEPVTTELAKLEQGGTPENNHIQIGAHQRFYDATVYQYHQTRGQDGPPKDSTSVDHAYIPIISNEHPFFGEMGELLSKYGSVEDVPEDTEWPSIDNFAVLMKTKEFKTIGSIPDGLLAGAPFSGLVVNRIGKLDKEEAKLVRGNFPKVDLEKILIVEAGRKPKSAMLTMGMMGGGGVLILVGLALLGGAFKKKSA